MALVEWDQRLSVDIKVCDEQHEKLIGLVNDLHELMDADKGSEAVGKIFRSTIACAKAHFKEEEKMMQAHGYPAIEDQKLSHQLFVNEVNNLFAQFKSGGILTFSVVNFMKRLEHHIKGEDKQYGRFVKSKGAT